MCSQFSKGVTGTMNKICKSYIADVKAFFPIKGKPERKYLKHTISDIEGFCAETEVNSKEDLCINYGDPKIFFDNYMKGMESKDIAKRIKISTAVRRGIAIFLIIAAVAAGIFGFYMHRINKTVEEFNDSMKNCYVKEVITVYASPTNAEEPTTEPNTTTATESAVENTTP